MRKFANNTGQIQYKYQDLLTNLTCLSINDGELDDNVRFYIEFTCLNVISMSGAKQGGAYFV